MRTGKNDAKGTSVPPDGPEDGEDMIAQALETPEMRHVLLVALRLSVTLAGLPQACRRRECRSRARCHAQLDPDGVPVCKGDPGVGEIERAFDMVLYLFALTRPEWRKDTHMRLPLPGFRLNR